MNDSKSELKCRIADSVHSVVDEAINKNGYKRVIALNSSFGKDLIPRVAGKHQTKPITDIIDIVVIFSSYLGFKGFCETNLCWKCII